MEQEGVEREGLERLEGKAGDTPSRQIRRAKQIGRRHFSAEDKI